VTASDLQRRVQEAFADEGPLARRDPAYLPREVQRRLADAVAEAIETRGTLAAEAGTGVGKTFAYLVPLLLSGRRSLVSTATKSLQDQLYLRDLPRLVEALGTPVRTALLKGRAAYLCRHRLAQARQRTGPADRLTSRALALVEGWARRTRSGDLAELDGLDDRSPVIPLVTSTRDNCLGSECPEFRACHVVQARREAMLADLVVVNHHLFFADLALRDSGVAELLPTVDAVVFDEAHGLVETGVQFLGTTLGSGPVLDLARDLLALGVQWARGLGPWADLAAGIETAARELRLAAAGDLAATRATVRLRWADRAGPPLHGALAGLAAAAARAREALEPVVPVAPDLGRLAARADALTACAKQFAGDAAGDRVRWIDLTPGQARLVESPLDIGDLMRDQRRRAPRAWVFTSATLGDDEALSWFSAAAGLDDAARLRVGSPYDHAAQARAWVPQPFARPGDATHAPAVGALAARCAQVLGGRTFVLTTTLKALPAIADALRAACDPTGPALEVLVQGSAPRRALLQRYGDGRGVVLVGSQTFWEGIDLRGDALQCVVIDKLPFPPPGDPLVEARVRRLEAAGRDAFVEYFVGEAAIALKQGAGRLIRSETDRGLLVVCDPRLTRMPYGRRLRAALPPMRWVDAESDAMAWLARLARDHTE
jgi:ATP-dependent DNA helicase DinG